ncbi:MAG: hypothetical protein QXN05_04775 [Acidilobaceae archaeon]
MRVTSLNLLDLVLVVSVLLFCVWLLLLVLICLFMRRATVRWGDVYVGGEEASSLSISYPSTTALYWGFTQRVLKEVYRVLRNAVHTGKLSDWASYMSLWYLILMLIALAIVASS